MPRAGRRKVIKFRDVIEQPSSTMDAGSTSHREHGGPLRSKTRKAPDAPSAVYLQSQTNPISQEQLVPKAKGKNVEVLKWRNGNGYQLASLRNPSDFDYIGAQFDVPQEEKATLCHPVDSDQDYYDWSNTSTDGSNSFGKRTTHTSGSRTKKDRPELQRWVRENRNDQITLCERLEKSKWIS